VNKVVGLNIIVILTLLAQAVQGILLLSGEPTGMMPLYTNIPLMIYVVYLMITRERGP
jgi:hypothetical protein